MLRDIFNVPDYFKFSEQSYADYCLGCEEFW